MKNLFSLIALLVVVLTGCSGQPEVKSKYQEPSWIMNPNQDGKIGAVGSSHRHINGTRAQRKLAMTSALDELSLQQGVDVKVNMAKIERVRNNESKTNLDINVTYNSDNTITAHIQEIWKDPSSGELYIWMVLD